MDKVPTDGDMVQFTPVLLEPVTVAFNVVDCPPVSEAVEGVTEIDTVGTSEIGAVSLLVESATLVAFTVTVCADNMVAGAVYTPLDKVPAEGDIDQVTPVLLEPVTVAFSGMDCPLVSDAVEGVNVIATEGFKKIKELALLLLSVALVAFTVMVCAVEITAGAV